MLPNIDQVNSQNAISAALPRRHENEKGTEVYKAAQAAENARAKAAAEPAPARPIEQERDQVEISLSLTREERDAFRAALSSKQNGLEMTKEEKSTLKEAAEKISGFIESVVAKNADNRERVEKAVGEWYAQLSKGEPQGPADLINLLRQAAMGTLDDMSV